MRYRKAARSGLRPYRHSHFRLSSILKIVQELLGHATIFQTMDTYSHVMPDMQDRAAAALESALS